MALELNQEQFQLMQSQGINGVLATTDLEGNPNSAPVHLLWAKDSSTLFLALAIRHQSSENLKTQGRYSLAIMEADDQAFSIQGKAKLIRQPMAANPHMALFKLEVTLVKSDTTPTVKVIQGVQTEKRNDKVDKFFQGCFEEMKGYE